MKKLAVLLAALLVLSCGTTFLAAPSPEVDSPEIESPELGGDDDVVGGDDVVVNYNITGATAVDSTGKEVVVKLNEVSDAVKAEAAAKAEEKSAGSQVLAIKDVVVNGATGNVTITFLVDGIKASDDGKIFILHEKDNGYWETISAKVEEGKVTATFSSLSPVAIVKVADTATTLPKTGAPVVLPVVALICAAGAAGCAKKVKFN